MIFQHFEYSKFSGCARNCLTRDVSCFEAKSFLCYFDWKYSERTTLRSTFSFCFAKMLAHMGKTVKSHTLIGSCRTGEG